MQKKVFQNKNAVIRTLLLSLLFVLSLSALIPLKASAHKQYVTVFTYDGTSWGGSVTKSDVGFMGTAGDHLEIKQWGNIYSVRSSYNTLASKIGSEQVFSLIGSSSDDESDADEIKKKLYSEDDDSDAFLSASEDTSASLFGFPYRHKKLGNWDATTKDQERANALALSLSKSYTDAVTKILSLAGADVNSQNFYNVSKQLAQLQWSTGGHSTDISVNDKTVHVTQGGVPASVLKEQSDAYDYQYLNIDGNYYRFLYTKGYREGDTTKVKSKLKAYKPEKDAIVLGYADVFVQGIVNKYVHDVDNSNASKFDDIGRFEQIIVNMFNGILEGLKTMLGLESIEDLIFNQGSRGDSEVYLYGIAPISQFNGFGAGLFVLSLIVAIIYVMITIIVKLNQWQISTITGDGSKRFNATQTLVDVIVVFILLGGFSVFFQLICWTNFQIVKMLYTVFGKNMFDTLMSGSSLASILIGFAFLGITAYINFVYILRRVTIIIQFGIAPILVATKLTQSRKNLLSSYMGELLGNVFLQTFHAIILSAIIAFSEGGANVFTKLVLLYSFIPLTKMLQKGIFQAGGDSTLEGGQSAAKTMGFMAAVGAAGVLTASTKTVGALKEEFGGTKNTLNGIDGGPGGGPGGGGKPTGFADLEVKPRGQGSTGSNPGGIADANKNKLKENMKHPIKSARDGIVGMATSESAIKKQQDKLFAKGKSHTEALEQGRANAMKRGARINSGLNALGRGLKETGKAAITAGAFASMASAEASYGGYGGAGQLAATHQALKREREHSKLLNAKMNRNNEYPQETQNTLQSATSPNNALSTPEKLENEKSNMMDSREIRNSTGIENISTVGDDIQLSYDTQFNEEGVLTASSSLPEETQATMNQQLPAIQNYVNAKESGEPLNPSVVKTLQENGIKDASISESGKLNIIAEQNSSTTGIVSPEAKNGGISFKSKYVNGHQALSSKLSSFSGATG